MFVSSIFFLSSLVEKYTLNPHSSPCEPTTTVFNNERRGESFFIVSVVMIVGPPQKEWKSFFTPLTIPNQTFHASSISPIILTFSSPSSRSLFPFPAPSNLRLWSQSRIKNPLFPAKYINKDSSIRSLPEEESTGGSLTLMLLQRFLTKTRSTPRPSFLHVL